MCVTKGGGGGAVKARICTTSFINDPQRFSIFRTIMTLKGLQCLAVKLATKLKKQIHSLLSAPSIKLTFKIEQIRCKHLLNLNSFFKLKSDPILFKLLFNF